MALYYIDLKYACFGIITKNKKIVVAPPIAKWAENKRVEISEFRQWVHRKGGVIKRIRRGKYA